MKLALAGLTMSSRDRIILTAIKSFHSAVFLVELTCIGWLMATGAMGRRDRSVSLAVGVVGVEAAVFVANRGVCPLTPLAERFGAKRGSVSDIFLPDVLARTLPIWSVALLTVAGALHLLSLWKERR